MSRERAAVSLPRKSVIIGTAGHIDHGKSSLVEALTGTHPDRLAEERRRGITIDLGFAHLDMEHAGHALQLGFVDVPGHERFVRNMLAGVGGIDLVLLVIAADESIKPQTREHFEICRLLGLRNGLVVLTKSDLVETDLVDLVKLEAEEFVRGSFLEGAPIVPVSVRTGAGLEALRAELARLAASVARRSPEAPMRLPIDRVFPVKGFGAVVTGTLVQGRVRREDEVELFGAGTGAQGPVEGRRLRVRGLQVHGATVGAAQAGQRTAVNLGGIETQELRRGMVLTEAGIFRSSSRLDVELTLLPAAPVLKHRSRVHLHLFSAEMVATVLLLDKNPLPPGERAMAQLLLAEPVVAAPGDRFIIRQFSPLMTMGGGRVMESRPARHRPLDYAAAVEFLRRFDAANPEERILLLSERAGAAGIETTELSAALALRPSDLQPVLRRLQQQKKIVLAGSAPRLCLIEAAARQWQAQIRAQLTAFHAEQPLLPGIALEDLRGRLSPDRRTECPAPVFRLLIERLQQQGVVEPFEERIRLAGRQVTLSQEETEARERIEAAFRSAGLQAPSVKEVLPSTGVDAARAQRILSLLLRERVLVRINDELILHQEALETLKQLLAVRKQQSPRMNVAAFKEMTGVSRKYAIPLLEHLDRLRLTRRVGDERIIV
jgi:selenocysteine-specific elongation factor